MSTKNIINPTKNSVVTNERGAALVVALIMLVVMTTMGATLTFTSIVEGWLSANYRDSKQSFYVAEAGIGIAIQEFNHGEADFSDADGWSDGIGNARTKSGALLTSDGSKMGDYTIVVTDPTGANPTIRSTGFVPGDFAGAAQRTVEVTLESESLFSMAAFGVEGVKLNSNARTDSYDSRLGYYGGGNVGSDGDVGTNSIAYGAIHLDSNARVYGDAVIGPGGNTDRAITLSGNATITGEKRAAEVTPLSITAPTSLPHEGHINLDGNYEYTITASGEYYSIELSSNSILIIDRDVTIYISGDLSLNSNSELRIINDAEVKIYVGGKISLDSNTQINNHGRDPTKLAIFGTDSATIVDANSNSDFYGTIYSPNAEINLDSNARIFGAIFGRTVNLDSNVRIHFDVALLDADDPSSRHTIAFWKEVVN